MDKLFATLTISDKVVDTQISGMSKTETISKMDNERVIFDQNWLLIETTTGLGYLKKGDTWAGGYVTHKIFAITYRGKVVLETFKASNIIEKIKSFFAGK